MDLEFHQLDLRYEGLRVRRPGRERRLLASLSERGQQVPIIVIALAGEPNRFLVIDGYKRLRAWQRLGQDTVRATVWDMDETAQYGLFDLDRLERMILRRIASEYFQLDNKDK